MNILHIVPYFPPASRFGGTPEAVFDLARAQSRLGNHVTVITTNTGIKWGVYSEGFDFTWLNEEHISATARVGGIFVLYVPNKYPELAEQHKIFTAHYSHSDVLKRLEEPPEVVHFHEVNIPGYRLASLRFRARGAKIFISPHGSWNPPVHRGIRKILHLFSDRFLRLRWARKANAFFILSKEEQRQLLKSRISIKRMIKMPLGCPALPKKPTALPWRVKRSSIETLLYVGRINYHKGVHYLIMAFIARWFLQRNTRLILCGQNENHIDWHYMLDEYEIPVFEDEICSKPGIHIVPPVNRSALPKLYNLADVTVCPSLYESFGLVPLESLLCGTPIVITEEYGCLEHIGTYRPGIYTIPAKNPERMEIEIEKALLGGKIQPYKPEDLLPSWEQIAMEMLLYYHDF